jgi:hypothetical protein
VTKALTKTSTHKGHAGDYAGFLRAVSALAGDMQSLVEHAVKEYSPVVENIIWEPLIS